MLSSNLIANKTTTNTRPDKHTLRARIAQGKHRIKSLTANVRFEKELVSVGADLAYGEVHVWTPQTNVQKMAAAGLFQHR